MTYEEALKTAVKTVAGLTDVERQALRDHPDVVLALAKKISDETPAGPRIFKDKDGDFWREHEERPGQFSLASRAGTHEFISPHSPDNHTLDYVRMCYGPLTEVTA